MSDAYPRNLVLVGFMGAGKSTIGKMLADALSWRFIDLDHVIEAQAGQTISGIFSTSGEALFRQMESAALRMLQLQDSCVIATGGGIVGRAENWVTMRQLGVTIYLQASWETLAARLAGCTNRPLARQEQGVERVRALYDSRLPLYRQADIVVDTDQGDPSEVAVEIIRQLKESGLWQKN